MRLFCLLAFLYCFLVAIDRGLPVWAEDAADRKGEAAAEEEVAQEEEPQEKQNAPVPNIPVLKKRPPLHELPVLKPARPLAPAPQIVSEAEAKTQARKKQLKDKQKQAAKNLPVRRRNAPFWSPRQGNLSAAAIYRLENMGRHVHLTPAMRWHLNRSGVATSPAPGQPLASTATVPGQGTRNFYPGVSRLPTQKPFADIQRPTTGIPEYWPLLLEGREDPNTGLIIWTLP